MKIIIRRLSALIFFIALISAGTYYWLHDKYVVPIMMYHHVRDTKVFKADTVSPARFKKHMAFLKNNGYKVIGLDELVAGIQSGRRLPGKTVVVTFDDGYEDNYTYAFPVLKQYGSQAIFFVSPGFVGTNRAADKYMDWAQIKEMHAAGMKFGSHAVSHVYLPTANEQQQELEILESKRMLELGLGSPVDYFAYPSGGYTNKVKDKVKTAGYKGATTTNRGADFHNDDPYALLRIRLSDKDNSDFILAFKLCGYYNIFRKMKAPY